jgi:RND family efflux transporter MFP subunit
MKFASLKAPIGGVVTQRNVEPGDVVGPTDASDGKDPLFVISQTDRVRVRIPVSETEAPLVNPGDAVQLTFPSFANEPPISGNVTRHSNHLDPETRTMLVEVKRDNEQGKLLPGMFGQARIGLDTQVATATLPSRAVRFDEQGDAYVYVLRED